MTCLPFAGNINQIFLPYIWNKCFITPTRQYCGLIIHEYQQAGISDILFLPCHRMGFYLWNLSIITLLWLLLLQVLQSKYKTCVWILGGWVASICVGQGHLAAQHHLKPQTLEASFFSLPRFRLFWLLYVFDMEWTEISKITKSSCLCQQKRYLKD